MYYEGPRWFRDPREPVSPAAMELRRLVSKQVEAEPRSLNMQFWESRQTCGTTRCISGWAQYYGDGETLVGGDGEHAQRGADLLELSEAEYLGQHDRPLFYTTSADARERMRELARDGQ